MFCRNCGNEADQSAIFCSSCGNSINEVSKNTLPERGSLLSKKEEFNFGKTFLYLTGFISLLFLIPSVILGEFEKDGGDLFLGIIIIAGLLGLIGTFFMKWLKGDSKMSGLTAEESAMYNGLNGWLSFVCLGLFITAGYNGYQFLDIFFGVTNYENNTALFTYDFFSMGILTGLSIYATYLFFKRKRSFPKYYASLLILLMVINLTTLIVLSSYYSVASADLTDYSKNAARSVMGAFIWVPYIFRSKRARATFIE